MIYICKTYGLILFAVYPDLCRGHIGNGKQCALIPCELSLIEAEFCLYLVGQWTLRFVISVVDYVAMRMC